jgi:hypothetical protein
LEAQVDRLPNHTRAIFDRIFSVYTSTGRLDPPESMHSWIENHFGSVDAVRTQRIVKVVNTVTWEGALFNTVRSQRPIQAKAARAFVEAFLEPGNDAFCGPASSTPEDVFGRVRGRHAITASNIAKYDGFHAVVIFDRHNPFVFSEEEVVDYVDTALRWGREAHASEPAAKYFFFMWNCSWKAGASIMHGHAQVALTQGMHYAKIEELRRDSLAYGRGYGANYFDDLFLIHQALTLGFEWHDVRVMSYLTPIKNRETLLVAEQMNENLPRALYRTLRCLLDDGQLGSFNVALYMPPIAAVAEDWSHFPVLFRVVHRGDPMNLTTDIGAMELYAVPVIGSDPFTVADQLREAFA